MRNLGPAGVGGLTRSSMKEVLLPYSRSIGVVNSIRAGLLSQRMRLELAK